MAFFTKKTWVARQGTGLNKFSINGATPVTVVNQPDSVTEQGDALSATNLNNLEQRIYNAFLDVDGVFDNIEDGIVLVGRAKADQNGDIIDETYAKQNGYYAELGAGTAEQLVSTQTVDDDDAYLFRTSGGSVDIGNRETDEIVGGTLGVNQEAPLASGLYKNGYTATDNADNGYTLTASSLSATSRIEIQPSLVANHVYFVNFDITMPVSASITMIAGRAWESVGTTVANTKFSHNSVFKKDPSYASYVNFAIMMPNNEMSIGDTVQLKNFNLIDLTAMFGSEIADYILALETATAGAGVAWFRRYFPKPYYPYNAGGLASVKPSSHDMTGFNQWDEEWEGGSINATTGANEPNASLIRSKNYIRVVEGQNYFALNRAVVWFAYDANKNFIGYAPTTDVPNLGYYIDTTGISYLRFRTVSSYGTAYKNDICLNVKWSGTRDGEYEPFELHSYPLDDSTEYRGIPKLDADGNLYFDGDVYKSSGDVTRKYGIVDMGDMDWTYNSQYDSFMSSTLSSVIKASGSDGVKVNVFTPKYTTTTFWARTAKSISQGNPSKNLYVTDGNYSTVADFKTGVTGQKLIYELATPTQETVNPFTNPQIVNDWGTEQYVDARDVPIPVGHNTQYMANLRDKLQHLPDLANADGEYVVKQTGTQMKLVKTDNLKKDGYYPTLAVGTADNLKGKGTVGANFTFRTSGGSADIGSGSARLDRINGNTLMLNQYAHRQSSESGTNVGVSYAYADGEFTLDGTASSNGAFVVDGFVACNIPSGHKLLLLCPSAHESMQYEYAFKNAGGSFISDRNLYTTEILTLSDAVTQYYCSLRFYSGANFSNFKAYQPQLIDLTQMFGSGNEPTVGEFKALFPLDYYDYTEGTPLNFKGTGLKTDGFNQWDEEWEVGALNTTTGENTPNSNVIRSKNFTKVFPSTTYYCKAGSLPSSDVAMFFYDANKNFLYLVGAGNTTFRTPSNAHYVRFFCSTAYGNTYKHDICINLSWSGIRNGEYEPYWDSTLPLPITTIKGKASGSDESVVIFPDGMKSARNAHDKLTAKKGVVGVKAVDLATLNWSNVTGTLWEATLDAKPVSSSEVVANIICDSYEPSYEMYLSQRVGEIAITTTGKVRVNNGSSSVTPTGNLYYEPVTPIEYTLDEELNLNYRVDDFGTEQLLPENTSAPTTSPLVAEIAYAMNAVDTLRNLDKNFTNLATLDALIAVINSKCGVTITRGSFDSANNRYTFS